ncbi:MAG: EAL domain-containing protein [Cellvibrionaceae bacterium]
MASLFRGLSSKLSVRQQLTLTFTLGIFFLAVVSSIVISSSTERRLHQQLLEQGENIIETLASQVTVALLYQSEESAEDAAQPILSFPNVIGVSVLTPSDRVLFHQGVATTAATGSVQANAGEYGYRENDEAWYFSRPVYVGDSESQEADVFGVDNPERELAGFVRIAIGKAALHAMSRDILRSNLLVASGVAIGLILLLLAITNRITKPLQHLSEVMNRAQEGETQVRATLRGSRDVIRMESAFNAMMSELERREKQLKRARDTALASARIKGQFATTVSHELRTPMNGVMGMLELLQSMELNEEQREYVNIARTSGEELLLLIDDVLDFSKIESGKMKLHPSPFDAREMVKGITELLNSQAQQKRLTLSGEVDSDVPETLVGDTGRIRQVLINMVGNAIKFTHQGSIVIRVAITKDDSTEQAMLRVSVEDTGIGIPESAQQLIFEAFAQADGSTTRQFGGTGLGLAICNQLVQMMGGKIGVRSDPGTGSQFWFTLPINTDVDTNMIATPSPLTGLRVLIVSRTTNSCHALVNKFITWDCWQRNTTTAEDAFRLLKTAATQGKPYDFVVIDTPLADGGETELMNLIVDDELTATAKVVVLTHNPQSNLPANAICIGKSPSADLLEKTLVGMLKPDKDSDTKPNGKTSASGHILVVDDNKANQLVARGMLERLGYTAQLAENGNAAIAALESEPFDLVLMDCHMPFMNGYTASQLIRGKESPFQHIPIIALTASVGRFDADRCFGAGMDDYVPKPLAMDKLADKLNYWLGSGSKKSERAPSQTENASARDHGRPDERDKTLDASALESLQMQIGAAFERSIEAYVKDTREYINGLGKAVDDGSLKEIKYFAHIIKGSSGNLGANRLANYCQLLEERSATVPVSQLAPSIKEIDREFERVKRLLMHHVESEAADNPDKRRPIFQPHILIVDDDQSSRIVMQGVLEKDGYAISNASNGMEALKYCQQTMPDLILMDALMPVMDGFTACERITSLDSSTYPTILMITALQDEGTLERAFAAGATDFILKPINMTVLRQRVSRVLHAGNVDRHIHQLSYYDHLTSLPNRTFFVERGKNLLKNAREHNTSVAVVFLDLDRFKIVNDTQGHDAGDLLLKTFAKRLESSVRSADLVSRLSGDEFTVALNNIKSREDAATVAYKILAAMKDPFTFMEQQVYISTSIGISLFPEDGETINELMRQADTAMSRAKDKGGNCFEFYQAGMELEITRQIELDVEIREALEQDEFVLYYQPQVDLADGSLTGLEALIRWQHPTRGFLPPSEFIPFAEKSDLITKIGDWVMHQACIQLRAWLDAGLDPVPIAVNVSGGELGDSVLLSKVKSNLQETNIPARLLKLEITEDTLAGGNDYTAQHLGELRNLGITLAIDDFGTGYSSLSYLKLFPVDTLKIDRSFIKDLPGDANSAAIISGIIALGHSLKLTIIAEGVETQEQKELLQREGCDIMQGYLLSKPLPVKDLEQWIVDHGVHPGFVAPAKPGSTTGSRRTRHLP